MVKRDKEMLGSPLELGPIRLLGGFICVDFHLGCKGRCRWCLNRRSPLLNSVLENDIQLDYASVGMQVSDISELVYRLPSFEYGNVPIRIGHLTDWKFEIEASEAFISNLPSEYPVVVMTRYPLSSTQVEMARKYKNLLVHITLTPYIHGYEREYTDPQLILDSVANAPSESLFFMIRPLIRDNNCEYQALIPRLSGFNVGFKGMSTDYIPGIGHLKRIETNELNELKANAIGYGASVYDFFGCVLRRNLRIPFFKYEEIRLSGDAPCCDCPNLQYCSEPAELDEMFLKTTLEAMAIHCETILQQDKDIYVATSTLTSRTEEVYLSELLCRKVMFNTVNRSTIRNVMEIDASIYDRWQQSSFYPVEKMKAVTAKIRALCDL